MEKVNRFWQFLEKTVNLGEKYVPILRIYLRHAVVAAQANPGLEKLHGRVFPNQAVSHLVILTQVVVRIEIFMAEFEVVTFAD